MAGVYDCGGVSVSPALVSSFLSLTFHVPSANQIVPRFYMILVEWPFRNKRNTWVKSPIRWVFVLLSFPLSFWRRQIEINPKPFSLSLDLSPF
ncbi:hypothetical protein L2E82_05305 [Cichorium intybus]|uniref:Uncharacterized protein n=1 Tax=Cichorium intybus TaxID=13427 RepID=A0ACB9H6Y2_CICIN|nr:hypothetical protein L2E82_05305 [Cichorium intybus]